MKKYNVAIVGATGVVGRTIIDIINEKNLPIQDIFFFASKKSVGTKIFYKNKPYFVEELNEENIKNKTIHYAIFSAGKSISEIFTPIFNKYGITVIDNSSKWRNYDNVPLIVPEINFDKIKDSKIIANPNCSTIQAVLPLYVLHKLYKIKRIIYTTFQSVSGAGKSGIDDLKNGERNIEPNKFPMKIYNNVIPQIGDFDANGYSEEENKMIFETGKILNDHNIKTTATTVRVPVYICHSVCINVQFFKKPNLAECIEKLNSFKGITVTDINDKNNYPTPLFYQGKNDVYVGRIRYDFSNKNSLNIWTVADNLRKGAGLNAVQILEKIIEKENNIE